MFHTCYFDDGPGVSGVLSTMVNKKAKKSDDPLAMRTKVMRMALGYETAKEFADAIGVGYTAYQTVEAGSGGLSKKMHNAIVKVHPDARWEWLQHAEGKFLTLSMHQRLRSAEAELAEEAGNKGKTVHPRSRRPDR